MSVLNKKQQHTRKRSFALRWINYAMHIGRWIKRFFDGPPALDEFKNVEVVSGGLAQQSQQWRHRMRQLSNKTKTKTYHAFVLAKQTVTNA